MRDIRLAPKQQVFVQALLKGATYGQAYRKAKFDPGGPVSDHAATVNGSALVKRNADIQAALKVSRDELRERSMLEACDIIQMLRETRELASRADPPQASAAVAAAMGIAKLLGLAVDKSEAHIVHHKPAPLPTALVELSESDWKRQFDPLHKAVRRLDFFD